MATLIFAEMPTKKTNTVRVDLGNSLEVSLSLNDWGLRRYNELLNNGISPQQALAQVKYELKQMGLSY